MTQERLCIKRGNSGDLLSLMPGEPAYSVDTKHLHIGNASGDMNRYLNSDQIASKMSVVKKELLSQIDTSQTGVEEIVRCNGLISNLHLLQKQLIQSGLVKAVPGIVPEKTNTNIAFINDTVYTVNFNVTLPSKTKTYYLCGCHDVSTSPNKGWYLAAKKGKLLFGDAATEKVSEVLADAIKEYIKFNLTLVITNGVFIKVFINNAYIGNFEATTLPNALFVLNASRPEFQEIQAPLIENAFIYNRAISIKEMQHNKQVIGAQQTIDTINDVPILINSSHVSTDDVFNLEQIYTNLLKNNCFDFISVNGSLAINNSIKNSKIIKLKIVGQTTGENAVKATLTHNGINYPFYASLIDKANNKVIQLNTNDALEIFEDGVCTLTQNAIVTPIPKALIPVIVLEEDNQFFVDSQVAPSEFSITAPVNQIVYIEELLTELESKTSALATLITEE